MTDDWDRRSLMSVLSIYMVPDILEEGYAFSRSGTYYAPPQGSLQQMADYFESLPIADDPEVFGMHDNANVTFNTNESLALMATLLSLQPRTSGGGSGKTSDDVVAELASAFQEQQPTILDPDHAGSTTFVIQVRPSPNPNLTLTTFVYWSARARALVPSFLPTPITLTLTLTLTLILPSFPPTSITLITP